MGDIVAEVSGGMIGAAADTEQAPDITQIARPQRLKGTKGPGAHV